jgi:hypothetical protein
VKFIPSLILLSLLLTWGTGCATSSAARKVMALDRFQKIYVEKRLNDNHHLDELFVAELKRLGREASSGPLTMMPENTEALLTYDARWEWDFKRYLIGIEINLHNVHPRKKLADGNYHQPTIFPKTPDKVIHILMDNMFSR